MAQLVAAQEPVIEEVFMELDGYFGDLVARAFMRIPGMLQVRADQYQFVFANLFHMITDHPFSAFGVPDEVQFKFIMVMEGVIKAGLGTREDREAIG
jgi:hypothetical protein